MSYRLVTKNRRDISASVFGLMHLLFSFDRDGLGLDGLRLRQGDGQYAVLEIGLRLLGLDIGGKRDRTLKNAGTTAAIFASVLLFHLFHQHPECLGNLLLLLAC
jgi:hypothetical protein